MKFKQIKQKIKNLLAMIAYNRVNLTFDAAGNAANTLIKHALESENPVLISRFGSIELNTLIAYLNMSSGNFAAKMKHRFLLQPHFGSEKIKFQMEHNAGFFPATADYLRRFSVEMLNKINEIDILGSWKLEEEMLSKYIKASKKVPLYDLEPFYYKEPWTEMLRNKKVLIIHPFAESIKLQYNKREYLFSNPGMLPEFSLKTVRAVQTIAGTKTEFKNWFDALDFMCREIDGHDFDIAIIGAGAYGFFLGSYIKSIGRKAIHLGGSTQLLFGIKGGRWDKIPFYNGLYNEHWVRPLPEETPGQASSIENKCYW